MRRAALVAALSLAVGCALPQECPGSLDAALAAHVGQNVSLRDLTDFPWARAFLFLPGARAQVIRKATGVEYRPYGDVVPRGRNLIAFQLGPRTFCLSSLNAFRYRLDPGNDQWLADAPWFRVVAKPRWRRLRQPQQRSANLDMCKEAASDATADGGFGARDSRRRLVGDLVLGDSLCPERP